MNLIGYDSNAVSQTYLAHATKLVACPHPSAGIVRVAEKEEFHPGVGSFLLKIVEIDGIGSVGIEQRRSYCFTVVVAYRREKAIIDRRLHQYPVAGNGQCLDNSRHGRYNPRGVDDPVASDRPAVPPVEPLYKRIVIRIGHTRISENTMFHPTTQSIHNRLGRTEIHIGHPHGQHIFTGRRVPFVRARCPARYHFIEIILHIQPFLFFTKHLYPTIGRSLYILVENNLSVTLSHDAAAPRILYTVYRTIDGSMNGTVLKSQVGIGRKSTIFQHQIMCITEGLRARYLAVDQSQIV